MPFIKRHDTINIIQQFGTIYVPITNFNHIKIVAENILLIFATVN